MLATCAALALAGTAAGSDSVRRVAFVITPGRISGLSISPDTSLRQVRDYLGHRGTHASSARGASCYLRFRKPELSAWFSALSGKATAANCTLLPGYIEVSSSRWHTANGLHVGDTAAALHRLFPKAHGGVRTGRGNHRGIPAHAREWQLAPNWPPRNEGAHLVLVGYVRGGRVVRLGVETFGH